LLQAAGIPVVPWVTVRKHELAAIDAVVERTLREIGLPCFVKPANTGSSVGISKVKTRAELAPALREAARYDEKLLVEQAVDGREIEIAVLGNERPEASVPGEIVPHKEWYDYEAKYVDESTELIVPAKVSEAVSAELQRLAILAFGVLEGAGLARVDFFLERGSDRIWLNELNSLPGFTEVSMYPRLWQASGLSYPALLDRLVELALERGRSREKLERTFQKG
jgi:D-alanine-D-alanine ligase